MPGEIRLTDREFNQLKDLVYDYCGIYFEARQKYTVQMKMQKLFREKRFTSFKDYYRFLKFDRRKDEAMKELMDTLTVNETYFYREMPQLDVFRKEILKELKDQKKDKRLRIWSSACSSGEEPYTLAMLIEESQLFDRSWRIEIFATDISSKVLQHARRGLYSQASFRTTSEDKKRRFFDKTDDNRYQIKENIKKYVNFSFFNLLNPLHYKRMGNMDVIFCRNVLIYFDLQAKKKVAQQLYDSLNNNGYLFISQTESLFKISNAFKLKTASGALMYQKQV